MDIQKRSFPTREALRQFAEQAPGIDISAAEVLLQVLHTAYEVRQQVFDVLKKQYNISEGKLMVMIILYQAQSGIAPSDVAEKAGVTRATISAMLRRMIRDGLAHSFVDATDGRRKLVALTDGGREYFREILPEHFKREVRLMSQLSEEERRTLVRLLKKIKLD